MVFLLGPKNIIQDGKTKPGKSEMGPQEVKWGNTQPGHKRRMNNVDSKDSKSSSLAQNESLGTKSYLLHARTFSLSLFLHPSQLLTPDILLLICSVSA